MYTPTTCAHTHHANPLVVYAESVTTGHAQSKSTRLTAIIGATSCVNLLHTEHGVAYSCNNVLCAI